MKRCLVHGVGIHTQGTYDYQRNGKATKEYSRWIGMLCRCYSEKSRLSYPTYWDCTVSDEFKDFQLFSAWVNRQIGGRLKNWELDKDLLVQGNRVYSAEACLLLPRKINRALIYRTKGISFPSVVRDDGKFEPTTFLEGCSRDLFGLYDSQHDLNVAYKAVYEGYLVHLAEEFKHQIDPKAYAALYEYRLKIAPEQIIIKEQNDPIRLPRPLRDAQRQQG